MKFNKKKVIIGSSVALALAGIGTAMFAGVWIGGGSGYNYPNGQTGFMSNTSNLNDGSFNQETLNGTINYERSFETGVPTYVPTEGIVSEYNKTLQRMEDDGINHFLTNGFLPAPAFTGMEFGFPTGAQGWLAETDENGEGFRIGTLVDDGSLNGWSNGISILFDASEAGFFAGIAAALHSALNSPDGDAKVTMWGGDQFNNVWDWMSGFEQGVNWFNYVVLGIDIYGNVMAPSGGDWNSVIQSHAEATDTTASTATMGLASTGQELDHLTNGVEMVNAMSPGSYTPMTINYGAATPLDDEDNWTTKAFGGYYNTVQYDTWFAGSFDQEPGKIPANNTASIVDVMFPVAGPQYLEALAVQSDAMVIGVDTDIANSYTDPAGREKILGSATKNLAAGTEFAIWYVERWTNPEVFDQDYEKMLKDGNATDMGMFSKFLGTDRVDNSFHGLENTTSTWINSTINSDGTETLITGNADDDIDPATQDPNTDPTTMGAVEEPVVTTTLGTFTETNEYVPDANAPVSNGHEQAPMDYTAFKGTYSNGGVGFVSNPNTYLEDAATELGAMMGVTDFTFDQFMADAMASNQYIIENNSFTFANTSDVLYANPKTSETMDYMPWIPDWNVYSAAYMTPEGVFTPIVV